MNNPRFRNLFVYVLIAIAVMAIILGVQVFCLGVVCDQISALRLERLGPSQLDVEAEEEPVSFATKRAA